MPYKMNVDIHSKLHAEIPVDVCGIHQKQYFFICCLDPISYTISAICSTRRYKLPKYLYPKHFAPNHHHHEPQESLRNLTTTEADLDNASSSPGDEKLREKAAKPLHGPNANPSQLGDPISLKAETSDSSTNSSHSNKSPSSSSSSSSLGKDRKGAAGLRGKEILRRKVTKKLHGSNANPSQLGDPISLKA